MEVKLFEGIESDPSVETVMKGAAVMSEFEPDWIVAIVDPELAETMPAKLVAHTGMDAMTHALLGIVHSMAHKTGAAFEGGHIIHGAANAMYLPKVIKFNSKDETAAKRYAYIAANALLDACTGSNPRQPSQEEMEKLLTCCYYDTEVDF